MHNFSGCQDNIGIFTRLESDIKYSLRIYKNLIFTDDDNDNDRWWW